MNIPTDCLQCHLRSHILTLSPKWLPVYSLSAAIQSIECLHSVANTDPIQYMVRDYTFSLVMPCNEVQYLCDTSYLHEEDKLLPLVPFRSIKA